MSKKLLRVLGITNTNLCNLRPLREIIFENQFVNRKPPFRLRISVAHDQNNFDSTVKVTARTYLVEYLVEHIKAVVFHIKFTNLDLKEHFFIAFQQDPAKIREIYQLQMWLFDLHLLNDRTKT